MSSGKCPSNVNGPFAVAFSAHFSDACIPPTPPLFTCAACHVAIQAALPLLLPHVPLSTLMLPPSSLPTHLCRLPLCLPGVRHTLRCLGLGRCGRRIRLRSRQCLACFRKGGVCGGCACFSFGSLSEFPGFMGLSSRKGGDCSGCACFSFGSLRGVLG